MDDEIIINGEVYVRKGTNAPIQNVPPPPIAPVNTALAVGAIQEKLARRKVEVDDGLTDSPDGSSLSVQMIKQKLR